MKKQDHKTTGAKGEPATKLERACQKTGLLVPAYGYEYEQYSTRDCFNREITFYLSKSPASTKCRVVLLINGSSFTSAFKKSDDVIHSSYQYNLFLDGADNLRLLVVEKPGLSLFCDGGSSFSSDEDNATAPESLNEFFREYTLDRWTEANSASLNAVLELPDVLQDRVLVFGHSDGGQVATHVARANSNVTHVASIAGGGPTQLFDLIWAATKHSPQGGLEHILAQWHDIQQNPTSTSKFAWGHPYNRWSSFCKSSSLEDLLNCKAAAYLVHGTADKSVPIVSFDVLLAELAARNRYVTYERIEAADHGLDIKDENGVRHELQSVIPRITTWFLLGIDEKTI